MTAECLSKILLTFLLIHINVHSYGDSLIYNKDNNNDNIIKK